jgi:hypothetical protein
VVLAYIPAQWLSQSAWAGSADAPVLRLTAKAQRCDVCPDAADVIQALLFAPAFACFSPAGRNGAPVKPDRMLLLVVDDDVIRTGVFIIGVHPVPAPFRAFRRWRTDQLQVVYSKAGERSPASRVVAREKVADVMLHMMAA